MATDCCESIEKNKFQIHSAQKKSENVNLKPGKIIQEKYIKKVFG